MQLPFRAHWEARLPPGRRGARLCYGATQQHLPPAATGRHTIMDDVVAQEGLMILGNMLPAQGGLHEWSFPLLIPFSVGQGAGHLTVY